MRYAEIASVYSREHSYQKALEVYDAWGMRGAEPGDYRAAAGAAQAAHQPLLVDRFVSQGLERFPNDPDLLEVKGKQEVARGKYAQGQSYLQMALRAARNPVNRQNSDETRSQRAVMANLTGETSRHAGLDSDHEPACHQRVSYRMPETTRLKLVPARYEEPSASEPSASPQTTNNQATAKQNEGYVSNAIEDLPETDQSSAAKQERIQDEIDVVENRNTPFTDIGSMVSGRAGDPGIDRLIVEDGILGGSATAWNRLRLTVLAHGLFLYAGTPNGQSKSQFGTLGAGQSFGTQSTAGITGELQLSTPTFGLTFSATPRAFPVSNVIGGIRLRPFGRSLTFLAVRDVVKDSLLSYAGARDPGTGIIWGGVVSNTGT